MRIRYTTRVTFVKRKSMSLEIRTNRINNWTKFVIDAKYLNSGLVLAFMHT